MRWAILSWAILMGVAALALAGSAHATAYSGSALAAASGLSRDDYENTTVGRLISGRTSGGLNDGFAPTGGMAGGMGGGATGGVGFHDAFGGNGGFGSGLGGQGSFGGPSAIEPFHNGWRGAETGTSQPGTSPDDGTDGGSATQDAEAASAMSGMAAMMSDTFFLGVYGITLRFPGAAFTAVPEPMSLAVLGLGILGLGAARRRRG